MSLMLKGFNILRRKIVYDRKFQIELKEKKIVKVNLITKLIRMYQVEFEFGFYFFIYFA